MGRPRLKWVDEVAEMVFDEIVNNPSNTQMDRTFYHIAYECNQYSATKYDYKNPLHQELVIRHFKRLSSPDFDP